MHPDLKFSFFDAPIGPILLAGDQKHVHLIGFPTGSRKKGPLETWTQDNDFFVETKNQLSAYFSGTLEQFNLPLYFSGTDFQNRVWRELCNIPYGTTTSYGELARRIGKPSASRAVGAANGANPLPIVVPCHRVIGSDKSLTGFGGGLATKKFLLEHEGVAGYQYSLL